MLVLCQLACRLILLLYMHTYISSGARLGCSKGSRLSKLRTYVSSYYYICVSSYHYICVLMSYMWTCCQSWGPSGSPARGATYYILYILYMCPHTTICAVKVEDLQALLLLLYVSSYYYMCPHTTPFVFLCYHRCVLILLYMRPHPTVCTVHVSSYDYTSMLFTKPLWY